MNSIDGIKTCRKGLHQYSFELKTCPECDKESRRSWREKNRESIREYNKRWYKEDPKRQREYEKSWCKKNPELNKQRGIRWAKENPERMKEKAKRWRSKNKDKINAYTSKYRAAKKQALPSWVDLNAIKQIYTEAAELTKSTGIRHEVDHIYPLKSDYMCGLHVETNLQVLTQLKNVSKKNRIWPGQLDCQRLPISQVFTPEQIALAQEQKDLT